MARPETKLRQMLKASVEAGLIVIGSKIDGDKIELIYETQKDTLPIDLADWRRR